jgi:hypothetical protein
MGMPDAHIHNHNDTQLKCPVATPFMQASMKVEDGVLQLQRAEKRQRQSRAVMCIMCLVVAVVFMVLVVVFKAILF